MTQIIDSDEFSELAEPFRRELLAHCYRMLGSAHDAEDLVQETLLRAWRSYDGFEGRSSLRVWLYRIATNACLRALERRERLPLPSGLSAPSQDPEQAMGSVLPEARWLEPIPGAWLGDPDAADPGSIAVSRAGVRLAFIGALQHLPARQRAALILRDVLAFSARETAEVLDTTAVAANSALQRARAQIAAVAPTEDDVVEPTEPERKDQLERYVRAFETADVDELLRLLRDDVVLEMPPMPVWFSGRRTAGRFLVEQVLTSAGRFRLVPVDANLQPGFAAYLLGADGAFHAHGINVLTLTPTGIARMVVFLDAELFRVFGLPLTLH